MPIGAYWQTASDGLIDSEGGALLAVNINASGVLGGMMGDMLTESGMDMTESGLAPWFERDEGIMFGRIVATGTTFDCFIICESDDVFGNTVVNLGSWFTTNREDELMVAGYEGGNILDSDEGGYDAIYNFGFTQTAFGQRADSEAGPVDPEYIGDYTSFLMDDFFNGGGLFSEGEGGLIGNGPGYAAYFNGALSMTDGDADDETYIFGNFHGSTDNTLYKSYLAVDVDFGPDITLAAEGYVHYGRSDVLEIGQISGEGDISGSTGVIANKLNGSTNANTMVGSQLLLATIDGEDLNWYNPQNNTCFFEWCRDGDTFFVSELSPDYVNVSGIGFVRDGMFMWGITEEPTGQLLANIPDPNFYWEATWGPDAYQQPTLITAAQTAWYETGGVVEDHIYGNVFPTMGAGGAGADLSYPAPEVPVPVAKSHSGAIWGRVTGSWANRDTEVIVDEGEPTELTFDTGYDQDTYSLLGGLEFKPGYGTMGDSEFRLGVFGGYVGSHVRYDDYGASAKLNGPTVGGYAALVSGGFYVDAEVKGDFLSVDYTTPSTEVSTRATSVGVLANAGYRMESGNSFLEPIVSAAFVNTSLDEETVGPTTITYSNGNSMRAGIGARVGTVMVNANGTSTELDLLGKVWNEFGDANVVTINDGMTTETFTDGITGVFGEVVGRATVYSADRSTSGFVSAGAKFGHDWTTLQAKAGVRQNF
jgi:hypothetical protein